MQTDSQQASEANAELAQAVAIVDAAIADAPLHPTAPAPLPSPETALVPITPLALRKSLIEEILRTRGVAPDGKFRKMLEPVVARPVDRFLEICFEFDRRATAFGFMQAARWMLPHFARSVEVVGAERIPREGPLLLVSNHPGGFDEVAIAAHLDRPDLRIFAIRHLLLTSLPAVANHAIFLSENDTGARMGALRTGIKQLRQGATLLLFPTGRTDPDPRCTAGASEAIAGWSSSIELLLNKAPETQVVVTLVSGVVSPVAMRNPLAWLRRQPLEKQKVAVMVQMALQMVAPRLFNLEPRVTFGPPQSVEQLTAGGMQSVQQAIIGQAQRLLDLHTSSDPIVEPMLLRG